MHRLKQLKVNRLESEVTMVVSSQMGDFGFAVEADFVNEILDTRRIPKEGENQVVDVATWLGFSDLYPHGAVRKVLALGDISFQVFLVVGSTVVLEPILLGQLRKVPEFIDGVSQGLALSGFHVPAADRVHALFHVPAMLAQLKAT